MEKPIIERNERLERSPEAVIAEVERLLKDITPGPWAVETITTISSYFYAR